MNRIILTVGILFTFAAQAYGENSIQACNGKTYSVGDTLRIGKPNVMGQYYHILESGAGGSIEFLNGDLFNTAVVITGIPGYDKTLYENFAIFNEPETPQVIEAGGGGHKYYIQLNEAIVKGYIMSEYKPSSVKGFTELSPAVLFVYSKKLYGTPVSDDDVKIYADLVEPGVVERTGADPFEWEELKSKMKAELVNAVKEADFNKVFRIRCISELGQYNIEKQVFPVSGYSCINIRTQQNHHLSGAGYCLWGQCGFHFSNMQDFLNIPCTQDRAKGFYSVRKYAKTPAYDKPVTSSYVYVKIKAKPVSLPSKEIMINLEWTTLQKEFGDKCLDMDIVQVDSYNYPEMDNETELVYNFLGTQK